MGKKSRRERPGLKPGESALAARAQARRAVAHSADDGDDEGDLPYLRLADRETISLRFAVGDRVECIFGKHDEWHAGCVRQVFYSEPSFPPGSCVPYQVELDDHRRIFVPDDLPGSCRAESSAPRHTTQTVEQLRLALQGLEGDMSRELREAIACGDVVQADLDLLGRLDDAAATAWWAQRLGTPCSQEGALAALLDQLKRSVRGGEAHAASRADANADGDAGGSSEGEDEVLLRLVDKHRLRLRFGIGDRVLCRFGSGWAPGVVKALFHVERHFPKGLCAPYQVRLDEAKTIYVPEDDDDLVRSEVAPGLQCEGCSQAGGSGMREMHAAFGGFNVHRG